MINYILSHFKKFSLLFILLVIVVSCSSIKSVLNEEDKLKSKEFDKLVKIESVDIVKEKPSNKKNTSVVKKIKKKTKIKKMTVKKAAVKKMMVKKVVATKKVIKKEEVANIKEKESKTVISEERLKNSPFVVGEKTRIEVSYLNMIAGYLTLETKNIVKVNGRLSYHFRGSIKSRRLFSFVYSVDDVADTYVDIETLNPYSLEFKVIETKKTKNSKTYFDWSKMKATYWSRKTKKGRKPKETKKVWDILKGSQNFVSALFYLRTIDFSKSKTFTFPLADEGKSIILKGKVLRREKIDTELGVIDTWLVEPEFQINGSLAPVGSIKMWFRTDKSQSLVKVATKLKFGSIVGEVVK